MPIEERVIEEESGIELDSGYDYNYSEAIQQIVKEFFAEGKGVADGTSSLVGTLNLSAASQGKGDSSSPELICMLNFGNEGQGFGFGTVSVDKVTGIDGEKYRESFHIGDAEIPLLVSKDTSVNRDTAVKNFFRDTSEFYQRSSDFESGSYSAFLKQDEHSQGKTIEEQVNDVYQLLNKSPQQNTVDFIDGKGHVAVESVSDTIDIQGDVREVEINIIFLEEV
jgi:hypothetical protein